MKKLRKKFMDMGSFSREELIEIYQQAIEHQKIRLLAAAKSNCKKFGIDFGITLEDLQMPEYCNLTGVRLTNILGKGRTKTNASLDRIDSTKGYVKGNVQIISDLANRMKQNASPEELIAFAKGVLRIYGRKTNS